MLAWRPNPTAHRRPLPSSQVQDMMEHKDFARYDTSSIEFMGGGGAPTPPSNVAKIAQKFPKGQPGQGYGLTEVPCFERRRKLHE